MPVMACTIESSSSSEAWYSAPSSKSHSCCWLPFGSLWQCQEMSGMSRSGVQERHTWQERSLMCLAPGIRMVLSLIC